MTAAVHSADEAVSHGAESSAAHGAEHGVGHGAEHGAEHGGAFPPFDPSTFEHQVFWFILAFVGLYFVMARFALPKVASVLEKRAKAIKSDVDLAAKASAQAEAKREAAEKARAKAHAEARALIDEVRASAQAELDSEQAKADKKLGEQISAAEKRINDARTKALADVDKLSQDVARDIVDKLLPKGAGA